MFCNMIFNPKFPPSYSHHQDRQNNSERNPIMKKHVRCLLQNCHHKAREAAVGKRDLRQQPDASQFGDDLLLETGSIFFTNSLATNSTDGCPVCLGRFDAELFSVYCAVLPCRQHALCVECLSSMKKQPFKEKTETCCPLCRFRYDGKIIQQLAYQIIDKDSTLSALIENFLPRLRSRLKLHLTCSGNGTFESK